MATQQQTGAREEVAAARARAAAEGKRVAAVFGAAAETEGTEPPGGA